MKTVRHFFFVRFCISKYRQNRSENDIENLKNRIEKEIKKIY